MMVRVFGDNIVTRTLTVSTLALVGGHELRGSPDFNRADLARDYLGGRALSTGFMDPQRTSHRLGR